MIKSNISKILGERRMSITDLANSAGIAYQTAHNLYHHKNAQLHYEVMGKVCAALCVQPGDLFSFVDDGGACSAQSDNH